MEIWTLVWKENLQGSSKEKMKGRRKFVNTEGIMDVSFQLYLFNNYIYIQLCI